MQTIQQFWQKNRGAILFFAFLVLIVSLIIYQNQQQPEQNRQFANYALDSMNQIDQKAKQTAQELENLGTNQEDYQKIIEKLNEYISLIKRLQNTTPNTTLNPAGEELRNLLKNLLESLQKEMENKTQEVQIEKDLLSKYTQYSQVQTVTGKADLGNCIKAAEEIISSLQKRSQNTKDLRLQAKYLDIVDGEKKKLEEINSILSNNLEEQLSNQNLEKIKQIYGDNWPKAPEVKIKSEDLQTVQYKKDKQEILNKIDKILKAK